jgi:hypothetical protein
MKKMSLKTIYMLLIFFIISCSKEGPQGPAGNNGTDGNANVMYSDWITYVANFDNIATLKQMRITENAYNSNFTDSGGFYIAFIRWQSNVHYSLPFEQRFNSISDPIVQMRCSAFTSSSTSGQMTFTINRQDFGIIQTNFTNLITSGDLEIRYFLIKGNINLRLKNGVSVQDYYKSKSYEEICALTGAPL